jgi:hypothetical protein
MISRIEKIVGQLRTIVAANHDLVLVVLLAVTVLALTASCDWTRPQEAVQAPIQPPPLPDVGKGWGTPAFVKMCRDPARHDPELCGDLR